MQIKKNVSGYRLHIKRLLFAADPGTAVTRTFKFPLVKQGACKKKVTQSGKKRKTTDFTNVPQDIVEAIKHDDLFIRGPSNLVDYIKYKNKNIYTLIDFWLDSLRAGAVFMPSTRALADFVTKIKDGKTIFERIVDAADPRFKKYFNVSKFINEIVAKGEMRKGKTRSSFVNTLQKMIRKELTEQEKQKAEEFIQELADAFFAGDQLKVIGFEAQNQIWKEFGVDKEAVDLDFDLTFFIFPELAEAQDIQITPENVLNVFDALVEKRLNWLQEHGYTEEEAKKQLDKILGLSDNFNAFSNYFGAVLPKLKEQNIHGVFQLLQRLYPNIGDREKQKLLWLSQKLQNLELPRMSGVNGWHEYRSLVGGKLQSWWSNHKSRQTEQTEQLEKLKEQLPKLKEFVHKYPDDEREYDEKLREDRIKEIEELLEKIGKVLETPEEIFADIKRYGYLESLIKSLRQKLNEYFQLYVKADTDKSPGDHPDLKEFWGIKIYKPRSFYGYAQREKLKKIVETTIPTIKQGIELTHHLLQTLLPLVKWQKAAEEKEGNRKEVVPEAGLRRFLEALRRKIKDDKLNTRKFKDFYISVLRQYLPNQDLSYFTDEKKLRKYTFYKSSYSTSTQQPITLPDNLDYPEEAKKLIKIFTDFLLDFPEQDLLNDPRLLLDFIETAKFVIARMFRWMDQEKEWNLKQFRFEIFPAAKDFIEQLKEDTVKTPMLRLIVMSTMFSEFRGAATVFNKKYVTAKWNVQVVGSDKKFKLAITPKDEDLPIEEMAKIIEEKSVNSELLKQIRWNVLLPTNERTSKPVIVLTDKDGNFRLRKEKVTEDSMLQICTSKYHLQFLERLLYKPKNWQNIKIRASEPSLIVEERHKVQWDIETGLPSTTPHTVNKPKLYYVLPLQFEVDRQNVPAQLSQIKHEFETNPHKALKKYHFLGADIGEYGIAWVILRVDEDAGIIEIKDYGFEYDNQIRKIQDKFAEIQKQARLGVFLQDTTVLAELRENAIGYLRNKLHDKLINYGGHIIYEANISGFEVGVGRITKIYDSVKRVDIGNNKDLKDNKTLNDQILHVWGLKTAGKKYSPGWQVGAAGTSYTCLDCHRSLYKDTGCDKVWKVVRKEADILLTLEGPFNKDLNLLPDYKSPIRLKAVVSKSQGESIKVGDLIVSTYNCSSKKENKPKDSQKEISIKKYLREKGYKVHALSLPGIIKNFSRPPIEKKEDKQNPYAIVTERYILKVLSEEQLRRIKATRGNSALFVCPFEGCHTVADADIQAAVVIALRGYLYVKRYYVDGVDKPYSEEDKVNGKRKDLLTDTLALLKNNDFKGKTDFIFSKSRNQE